MKLTKKQAKELCIKKWTYIVENNGKVSGLTGKCPELSTLNGYCGYCEKYVETSSKTLKRCFKCPIRPKIKDYDNKYNKGCLQLISPCYNYSCNPCRETAQLVLNQIINS